MRHRSGLAAHGDPAGFFPLIRVGELFGAHGAVFRFRAFTAFTLIWRAFPMGFMVTAGGVILRSKRLVHFLPF